MGKLSNKARSSRMFVQKAVQIIEEYKIELDQRGVHTQFNHTDDSFLFLMHYADGGHNGFHFGKLPDGEAHQLERRFTCPFY